ncbi:hypothetical protein FSO04_14245 [Paraburkholderia madseniana]|uniref:Uncharacterized protein n=1 Tax=Paraburkholderia madseniana TaxID=2599607 RepID=A0A6N6WGW1_9BURK|nr:hypothetical protein [Paraburkholderia madseniana]KAE8759291.1 hypothetical protein FSO04_14245 [Paraburkholderia madseniana]
MTSRKDEFCLPLLHGLRAIAALSVILPYGPTVRSVQAFKNYLACFGVDLFLALSAFLLSAGVEIWIDEALGLFETVEVIGYPQAVTACCPLIFSVKQSEFAARVLG